MLLTWLEIVEVTLGGILIMLVLMQPAKAGLGPAFGRTVAQQIFGGPGAAPFLARATAVCAAAFVITTVLLAWLTIHHR